MPLKNHLCSNVFLFLRKLGSYTHTHTHIHTPSSSLGFQPLPRFKLYVIKLSAYCHLIPQPPASESRAFLCHLIMEVTFGHISLKLRELGFRTGNVIKVEYVDTEEMLE